MSILTNDKIFGSFFIVEHRVAAKYLFNSYGLEAKEALASELSAAVCNTKTDIHPTSLQSFEDAMSTIFSLHVMAMLNENLEYFHKIADPTKALANEFIQYLSIDGWTENFINSLLCAMSIPGVSRVFTFANKSRISLLGEPFEKRIPRLKKRLQLATPSISSTESSVTEGSTSDATAAKVDAAPMVTALSGATEGFCSTPGTASSSVHNAAGSGTPLGLPPLDSSSQSTSSSSSTPRKSTDSPSGDPDAEHPRGTSDRPGIVQIDLVGPNLKAAWLNSSLASQLAPPPSDFHPSRTSGLRIYHGFDPQSNSFRAQGLFNNGLSRSYGTKNELSPENAVHTSFYALRSFLWAVFSSQVANFQLSRSQAASLTQEFVVNGNVYKGVLLLVYQYATPRCRELSTIVLDKIQMEAYSVAAQSAYRMSLKAFFEAANTRSIFGCANMEVPDVIHAPERPLTIRALSRYIGRNMLSSPIWRSGHLTDAAVDVVNQNRVAVYAISFREPATVSGDPKTRARQSFSHSNVPSGADFSVRNR